MNRCSAIMSWAAEEDMRQWSEVMKKPRKNLHVVALGRLGGLVRSEAKKRANRENGRKGGLVKSRKKRIAAGATPDAHDRDGERKDSSGSWGDSLACRRRRD